MDDERSPSHIALEVAGVADVELDPTGARARPRAGHLVVEAGLGPDPAEAALAVTTAEGVVVAARAARRAWNRAPAQIGSRSRRRCRGVPDAVAARVDVAGRAQEEVGVGARSRPWPPAARRRRRRSRGANRRRSRDGDADHGRWPWTLPAAFGDPGRPPTLPFRRCQQGRAARGARGGQASRCRRARPALRLAFLSLLETEPWGGSEPLAGHRLPGGEQGEHAVAASVQGWPGTDERLAPLANLGAEVFQRVYAGDDDDPEPGPHPSSPPPRSHRGACTGGWRPRWPPADGDDQASPWSTTASWSSVPTCWSSTRGPTTTSATGGHRPAGRPGLSLRGDHPRSTRRHDPRPGARALACGRPARVPARGFFGTGTVARPSSASSP